MAGAAAGHGHLHLPHFYSTSAPALQILAFMPRGQTVGAKTAAGDPSLSLVARFMESGQVGSEVLSPSFLLPVSNVCFPGEEFRSVSNLTAFSGLLIILTFMGSFRSSSR